MGDVLDFTDALPGKRELARYTFPPGAPNLQFLRDLCSGVCRGFAHEEPLTEPGLPAELRSELEAAVRRNVRGVASVIVKDSPHGGCECSFTAQDSEEGTYAYTFSVQPRWLGREGKPVTKPT